MIVEVNSNLDEDIKKVDELIKKLEIANEKTIALQFITISDLASMTGWSKNTVQKLFNRKDFPACDYGKEKKAEITAVKDFFKVRRSLDD